MRHALPLLFLTLLTACAGAAPGAPPGATPPTPEPERGRYVVMVSFDGLRYDYVDRAPTPNFDRVATTGVRATGLIPSYPSKTFPNHYTLATGLYPSKHGIVDNAFYDPSFDEVYALGDDDKVRDGRWYGGEPIWVTAERQGVRTASYFWVGSEAEIRGVRPSFTKAYDGAVPFAARVDTALAWLSLPEPERPKLVLLYMSEPDHTGHSEGPDGTAVETAVTELDGIVGRLLDGIAALPIAERVNVLLLSDHGMGPAPAEQVVYLDDVVDLEGVRVVVNGTQALLYFNGDEPRLWAVYEALQERLEHARVYLREETPARWHYREGRRIGDLVVAADPGWLVATRDGRPWNGGGMHGWDPYWRPMHGTFIAAGPGFRPGVVIPAFENVHIHPLVAHLLGLAPAPGIDGRLDALAPALAPVSVP